MMLRRAKRAAVFAAPIIGVGAWAASVLKDRRQAPPDVRFSIGSAGESKSASMYLHTSSHRSFSNITSLAGTSSLSNRVHDEPSTQPLLGYNRAYGDRPVISCCTDSFVKHLVDCFVVLVLLTFGAMIISHPLQRVHSMGRRYSTTICKRTCLLQTLKFFSPPAFS